MKKKLLICTQVVDRNSSTLGFMISWIDKLAANFDQIEVICLYKGEYTLPSNVTVNSLGKEDFDKEFIKKNSIIKKFITRAKYLFIFYYLILKNNNKYDKVFIHQIQEYALLGGLVWKVLGKKIYLWRNHYSGNFLTALASHISDKVFYTSKSSYTARFTNALQMPVGVDIDSLNTSESISRIPDSILSLARLDPSKRPDIILKALKIIKDKNVNFTARFVGGTSADKFPNYEKEIKDLSKSLGLEDKIDFVGAVPSSETYKYYLSSEIYINASKSGMLDKTIFKALAAGCVTLTASDDYNEMIGNDEMTIKYDDDESLANKLDHFINLVQLEKDKIVSDAQEKILKITVSKILYSN